MPRSMRHEGALKATNGAGLQPAMDHILENDGKPVPDLGSVTSAPSAPSAQPEGGEDDEDLAALRAQYGGGAAAASSSGEASEGVAQA